MSTPMGGLHGGTGLSLILVLFILLVIIAR
ncbi:YjcZ family sporulation protein [Ammoniphilus sp. CFH 90114]|nr:YjcZ family sporulation protein [Ammoniphilus sp. CFH 90114]RXT15449.1 YjcZ family sporulation protein [Ammoniphilus sp. CFH 90114]